MESFDEDICRLIGGRDGLEMESVALKDRPSNQHQRIRREPGRIERRTVDHDPKFFNVAKNMKDDSEVNCTRSSHELTNNVSCICNIWTGYS
ncbi:hypothetical protein E5676_scaffold1032G00450 [Cucumis melo var. makuwa]|uniref:Uncharacterized protein n=1 Tax=Cucumis melo var. makuwa TaxID=1194695 RepID=A0A5A7SPK7_CUCMM|nr:hypothetical protein E6C27_scaffold269G002600 [Cucumis melo var. makuwa]TYK17111.1 hypothetical protein E5676_scaffold1032G00450 [Cucumis melo var. makuwa]